MWHGMSQRGQIVHYALQAGNHFFDQDSRRFWGSRVGLTVYPTGSREFGTYFVTSELTSDGENRRYTVRRAWFANPDPLDVCGGFRVAAVDIKEDLDGFLYFASRTGAHEAAKKLAARDRKRVSLLRNEPKRVSTEKIMRTLNLA